MATTCKYRAKQLSRITVKHAEHGTITSALTMSSGRIANDVHESLKCQRHWCSKRLPALGAICDNFLSASPNPWQQGPFTLSSGCDVVPL